MTLMQASSRNTDPLQPGNPDGASSDETRSRFAYRLERALLETRPALAANLLLFAIVGFLVWAVIWAHYTELDEVTRGSGTVIPSSEVQLVQSLEGGRLAELLVQEGDQVEAGQVLARIDDVDVASAQRSSRAEILGLEATIARLKAEADGTALSFPDAITKERPAFAKAEQALYEERKARLQSSLDILRDETTQSEHDIAGMEARISQLTSTTGLVQQELNITSGLVKEGVMAEVEAIRLRQKLAQNAGELRQSREALQKLKAELSASKLRADELTGSFRSAAREQLNSKQVERASLIERQVSVDDRVRRSELRAPVAGEIKSISLKTEGGVLRPGTDFIEIVPREDDLKINARIKPADIAFLHPGQAVKVKITAYDYAIYGLLTGHVERIGADTLVGPDNERYYEIEVRTDHNYLPGRKAGERLPIRPGMVAEVEVLTGKHTILTYLLKPLTRIRERAMTEP